MSNLGTTLLKIAALAGGALIGAVVSRLYDEALSKRAEERSQRDKTRYAQGLSPIQQEPHQ